MKRPLESAFQRKFLKKLKTLTNCWFFKSSDRVRNGIPDVIVCKDGKFMAFELKRDDKAKATPLQQHTIEKINEAGGTAQVVSPENFEDIWEMLSGHAGALK